MSKLLRVLNPEDSEEDSLRLVSELLSGGYELDYKRIDTPEAMREALTQKEWDIVISDFSMPQFSGLDALEILKKSGLDLPFIIVSGAIGEEKAINALKAGAHDFIGKDNLTRLLPAIKRELRDAEIRRDRVKKEEALRQSEERFRILFETMGEGAAIGDFEEKFIFTNPALENIFGVESGGLIGRNLQEFLTPESAQTVKDQTGLRLKGERSSYELEIVRDDGARRQLIVTANPTYSDDDDPENIFAIFHDITVRKHAEAELIRSEMTYRDLVDRAGVAITIDDADGFLSFYNKRFAELFGYYMEELIDQPIRSVVHPDDIDRVMEYTKMRHEGKSAPLKYEFKGIRKDKSVVYLEIDVVELQDKGGKTTSRSYIWDITERKQIEEALQQAKEQYRVVFEHAGDYVMLLDIDQDDLPTIIDANEAALQIHGYSRDEIIGKPITFIDHDMTPEMMMERKNLIDNYGGGTIAVRHVRKDGSAFHAEAYIKMVQIGNKNVLLAIERDITKLKQAEEALHGSEAQLANAVKIAKLGPWEYDVLNDLFIFNDAFYAVFRTTAEEVGGYSMKSGDYAKRFVHLEDAVVVGQEVAKAIETDDPNYSVQMEHRIKHADGELGYISVRFFIVKDDKGRTVRTYGVNQDITERKRSEEALRESEERFRAIASTANDAIIMVDDKGNVTYWNPGAENIFGYNSEEIIGKNVLLTVSPELHHKTYLRAFSQFQRTLDGLSDSKTMEIEALHKNGRVFPIELSLSVFQMKGNRHMVGIVRDVSERKQLEIQLRQSQKMEAVGTLAAGIAHEINTPTQFIGDNINFFKDAFGDINNLINKFLELCAKAKNGQLIDDLLIDIEKTIDQIDIDYLREEIPIAVQQSLDGIQRVTSIVRAMRDFAHPGPEEKTPLDINNAINSTITVARNEWKYVADLETDFDMTLPLVPCIPGEFNQIILNIIVNAGHALEALAGNNNEKKGKIKISTGKEDNFAVIRIADTGTGIPEAIRNRIFDPFFTTKEVGKGTGQGLAIAHSVIVEKHNGKIDFETEEGKGTTFIIHLPLNEQQVEKD